MVFMVKCENKTITKDKTYFVCFSKHLAGYLLMNGCAMVRLGDNNNDSNKKVFVFLQDNCKVDNLVSQYKEEYRK
jgi:hypothetical protein